MVFCTKQKAFAFFTFVGFIFCFGCSSSSNSIRYGTKNDTDEKETRIRYTRNEDIDTLEIEIPIENEIIDPDDVPEDITSIDISVLKEKYKTGSASETLTLKEKMLMEILRFMNTPYKFGGNSKGGIDCSGFTQTIYQSCSIQLNRSAKEQFAQGIVIDNKEELKFGDLVFFNTRKIVKPGHVGIYLGDNLFVHASSKNGVIVTPLTHEYYFKRYLGARRIEQSIGFQ